jgi:hypothetical protein
MALNRSAVTMRFYFFSFPGRARLALYMDAHILPDISVDDFEKVKIAVIHPDFA